MSYQIDISGSDFDSALSNVSTILLDIYPIGSIYMNTNNVNPETLFGGTWEQIQSKFLLGAGSSYTAGSTGGEITHTLTINEMPNHEGHAKENGVSVNGQGNVNSLYLLNSTMSNYGSVSRGWNTLNGNEMYPASLSKGGGQAHNNMPPFLSVYVWKRIA